MAGTDSTDLGDALPETLPGRESHDPEVPAALREFMAQGWLPPPPMTVEPAPWAPYTAKRRAALAARFPGEALVIPSGSLKVRANDTDYPFRPGSDFYWLTGEFGEDAVLVLRPAAGDTTATLFVHPRSNRSSSAFYTDRRYGELWVGPRPGLEETAAASGIATAPLPELPDLLATLDGARVLRGYDPTVDSAIPAPDVKARAEAEAGQEAGAGEDAGHAAEAEERAGAGAGERAGAGAGERAGAGAGERAGAEAEAGAGERAGAGAGERAGAEAEAGAGEEAVADTDVQAKETAEQPPTPDQELAIALSELRLIKDDREIALLSEAIEATVRGFADVVRELPRAIETSERWIEGTFDRRARVEGNDVGYGSICACGPHATTLHWVRNDGAVRPGELMLLDMGVESRELYTADVTRTLPISGRWSPVQRQVYDVVFRAQTAAIQAVRPGADFLEPHRVAMRMIAEALWEWGILPVPVEEALEKTSGVYQRYTLHGTSHMLGLDVHDCAAARSDSYRDGTLTPGMVLTVEPGLYFQPDDLTVPEHLRGIGVRIEDDILVTDTGHRNLSEALPRDPDKIERWMAHLLPG